MMSASDPQGPQGPPPASPVESAKVESGPPPQPRALAPWWLAAGVVALFVGGVLFKIFAPNANVTTDDARVAVHYAVITSRVPGQVATVDVDDDQPVAAGQLLATIDPRDNETAMANAQANLERDQARVVQAAAADERQSAAVQQASSLVPAARARLVLARADAARYRSLAKTGAASAQVEQQADVALAQASSDLTAAQAGLDAAQRQLMVSQADRLGAAATVRADKAALAQARLNVEYTRIVAPFDGTVGIKTAQVGDYVTPGGALMSVVPLRDVYVLANYLEVQLRRVRPGQPATIHVDAYGVDLQGVVASLAPASGATFSAVPPENATGNFTKIGQRLPVKIRVAPGQPLARLLKVGLSVETTIHTGQAEAPGASQ
jgi:membrane fusion protein (multidrug efflux system)